MYNVDIIVLGYKVNKVSLAVCIFKYVWMKMCWQKPTKLLNELFVWITTDELQIGNFYRFKYASLNNDSDTAIGGEVAVETRTRSEYHGQPMNRVRCHVATMNSAEQVRDEAAVCIVMVQVWSVAYAHTPALTQHSSGHTTPPPTQPFASCTRASLTNTG